MMCLQSCLGVNEYGSRDSSERSKIEWDKSHVMI